VISGKKEGIMKFIDFILKAQKEPKLVAEFLLIDDAADLEQFFKDNKFTDIDRAECVKIMEAMKVQYRMSSVGIRAY
jgi:hypothetical protein